MKRFFAAAFLIFTFAACKKHHSDGIQLPANTWTIYGETYTNGQSQRYTSSASIGFTATGFWTEPPYLVAHFFNAPASGIYKVVDGPVAANEVSFSYTMGFNPIPTLSTSTGAIASVTVRNGKATIIANNVHMQAGANLTDTTTLSLNLSEF